MAGFQLKVAPDELKNKAIEIEGQIANVEKNWNSLCETVNASRRYWEGDAAEYRLNFLGKIEQDVQEALQRLREQPLDLMQMAGIYIDAETKAVELASHLPDDVLQ